MTFEIYHSEASFMATNHDLSYSISRKHLSEVELNPVIKMQMAMRGVKSETPGQAVVESAIAMVYPLQHSRVATITPQFQRASANIRCGSS
jgi:hypothetical protein